jgi:uncharacterized repeat protein (TIGR01451 family)
MPLFNRSLLKYSSIDYGMLQRFSSHSLQLASSLSLAGIVTLLSATSAVAARYTVINSDDSGPGSLRDAVAQAEANSGPDTIVFDASLAGQTITLTSKDPNIRTLNQSCSASFSGNYTPYGALQITESLTVDGSGAPGIIIDGNWDGTSKSPQGNRIFYVPSPNNRPSGSSSTSVVLDLRDISLENGNAGPLDGGGDPDKPCSNGGNIYFDSNGGELNLTRVNIRGGHSNDGGGLNVERGDLNIYNSTLSDNLTRDDGGAIDFSGGGSATVVNSTIANNTAGFGNAGNTSNRGGAVRLDGVMNMTYVTVAHNTASGEGGAFEISTTGILNVRSSLFVDNDSIAEGFNEHCRIQGNLNDLGNNWESVDNPGDAADCTGFNTDTEANIQLSLSLADNGGPTQTLALAPSSSVNAIIPTSDSLCPEGEGTTDQRYFLRAVGAGCEPGAYELASASVYSISGNIYQENGANNTFDSGTDTPLPDGITINLYQTSDPSTVVATTLTTGGTGSFDFGGLPDGDYFVEVDTSDNDIPSNLTLTSTNPVPVTIAGANLTNVDFAFIDTSNIDFGDAPDTYGTDSVAGNSANSADPIGAVHTIVSGIHLGTAPDAESDAATPLDGTGDGAEDDGITLTPLSAGDTSYSIPAANIAATGSGTLHGWVDFNKDGVFEASEHTSVEVTSGTPSGGLSWSGITVGAAGDTYARFRFTSDAGITPNTPGGVASDGEVEDYRIAIASTPIGSQPFICDSSLYIVIGDRNATPPFSQLNRIDRTTDPFTFAPVGSPALEYNYNALAYNPVDNYLYGFVDGATASSPFPTGTLVRIGDDGVPVSLGTPQDSPGYVPNAGTFLANGTYVIGRQSNPIYTINLNTTPPTATARGTVTGTRFEDFAVNPYDMTPNRVYGIDDNSDRLVYFDVTAPGSGATNATANGTSFNHNYGSQFYDSFGNFLYRSATTDGLYILEADGSSTLLANSADGGSHDGASCFSVGLSKKTDSAAAAAPVPAGQTVTYTYQIANASDLPMTVTLSDDLRSVDDYAGSAPDESSTPVNGTYTGTINAPLGSNVTISDSDQSLTISDIPLSPQSITTITAEVTLPATAPVNTYYNQAILTGMPAGFVSLVQSDDPTTALYGDPTAVETAPVASNPNIALVKRITAINRGLAEREQLFDNSYVDVAGDPNDNETNWPLDPTAATVGSGTVESYISGLTGIDNLTAISGTTVRPGDQIEYTIPFLSNGDTTANDVLICDRIPQNTTFVDDAFNSVTSASVGSGNRGIYLEFNNQQVALTNTNDSDEISNTPGNNDGIGGYYFAPGVLPSNVFPDIDCGGSNSANDTGAIVVDLGDVPNATGEGTPDNSYGLIRFRVSVD